MLTIGVPEEADAPNERIAAPNTGRHLRIIRAG
jgi:hypothetical protein